MAQNYLSDPLVAAFSNDEVARAGGVAASKSDKKDGANQKARLNADSLPDRDLEQELQEAIVLARQTVDADPQQVIKDCRLLHEKLGVQPSIYEVAAEAYIRLQLFGDAETCLLIAYSLGSTDSSVPLNLANLATMRGDQRLSMKWLEQVAKDQPDHPQLEKVQNTLFPKGAPKQSSNPFQINLDQRAPGNFKQSS